MSRAHRAMMAVLLVTLAGCPPATAGRWRDALKNAATDRRTWLPAAGAFVFAASGADDALSEWAFREAPVFGSPTRARAASDWLRTATHAGMLATSLVARQGEGHAARLRGVAVRLAAASAANNAASLLKRITGRRRPDGSDDLSLPSNHATAAFAYAAIGSGNLERLAAPAPLRKGFVYGLGTLAAASAWGRVEGGVHYPSDVLLGAALGNFGARFLTEALLPSRDDVRLSLDLSPKGVQVGVSWTF